MLTVAGSGQLQMGFGSLSGNSLAASVGTYSPVQKYGHIDAAERLDAAEGLAAGGVSACATYLGHRWYPPV